MSSKLLVRVVAIALIASGCASQEKKSEQALQSARSSVSAAVFTGDAWLRGHVPDAFAGDAYQSAEKQLQKSGKTPLPGAAAAGVKQAIAAVQMARSAVQHNDRARVTESTGHLLAARDAIEQTMKAQK